MMFNYPYIGYPFYNNYYRYFNNRKNNYWNQYNNNNYNNANSYNINSKMISNNNNSSKKNEDKKKSNPEYIDILGIRLYFDDILLILLIYFLYNENVKDTGLFITLILLLLG